jgi:hypothetical protein
MIASNEVRNGAGQIEFPLATLENTKVQWKAPVTRLNQEAAMFRIEINLSGSEMLAGLSTGLCFAACCCGHFLSFGFSTDDLIALKVSCASDISSTPLA